MPLIGGTCHFGNVYQTHKSNIGWPFSATTIGSFFGDAICVCKLRVRSSLNEYVHRLFFIFFFFFTVNQIVYSHISFQSWFARFKA